MNTDARRPLRLTLLAALPAVLLSACVVAPPRAVVSAQVPVAPGVSAGVTIGTAPPAPIYETAPVMPAPGYVWTPGYWGWGGARYVWTPGRWAMPPHAGATWVPYGWARSGGGWRSHGGHWR